MAGCSIQGCTRPRKSRGWCNTHYERWRLFGDPMRERETKLCTVQGCSDRHASNGICQRHYDRARRLGNALAEGRYRGSYVAGQSCAADGCTAPRTKREWCDTHYRRWQRTGSPDEVRYPKAERLERCIACGEPTTHGLRQFCSNACRAFVGRAGKRSRDTCKLCNGVLPVVVGASGMRKRGNGHGYCLACAKTAPCVRCGTRRDLSDAGNLVCRPCRRPRAVADQQVRRARKLDAICEHGERCVTAKAVASIRAAECFYCGDPAEHADHFEPLARGGKHCRDNLVAACARCNLTKSDNDPWQWWTRQEAAR